MNNSKSRIATLMESQGYTFVDLEKKTGIPHSALQRYSTGQTKKIPYDRLWKLAFALNTTPDYLVGSTNDPTPQFVQKKTLITNIDSGLLENLNLLTPSELQRVYDFVLGLISARSSL